MGVETLSRPESVVKFAQPKQEKTLLLAGLGEKLLGFEDMKDFVQSLQKPRYITMVCCKSRVMHSMQLTHCGHLVVLLAGVSSSWFRLVPQSIRQ